MKLVRFGNQGSERPGIWLDAADGVPDRIVDVRASVFDIEDYDARFWATWGVERLRGLLREANLKLIPAEGVRLGPPVARPGQIVALGKNYRDHAEEFDATVPERPVYFSKSPNALTGPADSIFLTSETTCVDAEVELALVIGKTACRVKAEEAFEYVAGYTVFNDVTDRRLQRAHGQWFFGKSVDSFGPMGPCLVTADEIGTPQALRICQRHNGRTLQESNTSQMIFGIEEVLADVTRAMTLQPGDILSTGTPGGIGSARNPPVLLASGDVVECEIESIGCLVNRVVSK